MEKLTLRSDKGSPLTHAQMDKNFTYPFSKATYFEIPNMDKPEIVLKVSGLIKGNCKVVMYFCSSFGSNIFLFEETRIVDASINKFSTHGQHNIKGYIFHDEDVPPQIIEDTSLPYHPINKYIFVGAYQSGNINSVKVKLFGFGGDSFIDELTIISDFVISRISISKNKNKNAIITPLHVTKSADISNCTFTYENGFLYANITFSSTKDGYSLYFNIKPLFARTYILATEPIIEVLT